MGTREAARQLQLVGLDEALRHAESMGSASARGRAVRQVEIQHDLLTTLPGPDQMAFLHAGLCQTFLPHRRPIRNTTVWQRESGRFTLMVQPGIIRAEKVVGRKRQEEDDEANYVGVPFGPKARLILIHLQTEGLRSKSRTVHLGDNLSAFLRSLGVPRTGGPRGSITAVKEQCMRIARCSFTLQWDDDARGRTIIKDQRIVEGLEIWNTASADWQATVELSERFHEHLREHAVPLDKRGIAILQHTALGLDLYALFAHRLPRLKNPLHLSWEKLKDQIGSEYAETRNLAVHIRQTLPDVLSAYTSAKVEVVKGGLLLRKSTEAVPPKTTIQGFRLIGQ